ncbi:bifunctional 4-hydroxy-2-oxoglutarate aldolase/2-dehydro-3-deoxy-phosphogluconate aldolase [Halomarina oriensis]|uniref:Bifunctional 4-hydroxy-2-oxoglutarate aldolase/2-dehydro-3-deoxy-phosphogluconate aldolase n=1 Tax=Halomarina oriensis TaxID=671145 RepID=A0A6B0GX76_9EURY|nr:bifunctional 4-hydroxy-2-oxoglutarate aldolase/2-dehydro-3-deoxy-phosphogluconate aldolase [Halomarina oriensis]MWG36358.1 bifunctional 4-hydroxy-2-oxoglutarate aldolase/2-dehydro-3-deoxy-phosphogluconate aldolase [Halomarina oriensis]
MTHAADSTRPAALERLVDTGLVAVVRGADADRVVNVVDALVEGGVRAVELTADSEDAMGMLRDVSSTLSEDVSLGVGTVLDAPTARQALLAGAEFVVTPSFDPEVVTVANRYGTPVAPGVYTPTEAVRAYEAGADLLKLFPASTGGPGHLKAIKGPLGHVPIVPTGGVSLENVADFIDAGALGVGVGGSLVDSEAVAAGQYEVLTENARAFRTAIDEARADEQ